MLRRKRKNSNGSEVQARLSALRSDFGTLQKDIRGLMTDVVGRKEIQGAMDVVGGALQTAQQQVGKFEEWGTENLGGVRKVVRDQPLAACVLSLGAGAIIGALLMR